MHVCYAIMDVWNNLFFFKFLLVFTNLCNFRKKIANIKYLHYKEQLCSLILTKLGKKMILNNILFLWRTFCWSFSCKLQIYKLSFANGNVWQTECNYTNMSPAHSQSYFRRGSYSEYYFRTIMWNYINIVTIYMYLYILHLYAML